MLIPEPILKLMKVYAAENNLELSLVAAICLQESGMETWRSRYEPNWAYPYMALGYSNMLSITFDTEINHQKTSWGLMQVMGSVARELGYEGYLQMLSLPEYGLLFGCKKLAKLKGKYSDIRDVISAYNQGSPLKRSDGTYRNETYVAHVLTAKAQYASLDK